MTVGTAASLLIDRIVTPVAKMHRTISGRWFSAAGPLGKPIRPAHDAIVATVYESVRLAGSVAGIGIDAAITGSAALTARTHAVANGLWGDELGRHGKRLEIPMSLRDPSGAAISIKRLEASFPDATGHVVVLVHGFADTERSWLSKDDQTGLVNAIAAQSTLTPVLLRYNTGRSVIENGALLADLLDQLHNAWPVPVESVALVGHSMGGLVIRSACGTARAAQYDWLAVTGDIVTLGAPHLGTPIEKLVWVLAEGLGLARETAPLQEFVDTRSQGIKDLRSGGSPERLPPGIKEHFVAGVATANPAHPVGSLIGDFVVRVPSASGGSKLAPSSVMVANGVRHNQLVRDKGVVDRVVQWLQPQAG